MLGGVDGVDGVDGDTDVLGAFGVLGAADVFAGGDFCPWRRRCCVVDAWRASERLLSCRCLLILLRPFPARSPCAEPARRSGSLARSL